MAKDIEILIQEKNIEEIFDYLKDHKQKTFLVFEQIVKYSEFWEDEDYYGYLGPYMNRELDKEEFFSEKGILVYGRRKLGKRVGSNSNYINIWLLESGEFIAARCKERINCSAPVSDGAVYCDVYDQTDHVKINIEKEDEREIEIKKLKDFLQKE